MTPPLAVVVGAGGVLGEALLRRFEAAGYRTAGLRRGSLVAGGQTRTIACDLGDSASVESAVVEITAGHGAIEVLVCNAAHFCMAPFLELRPEDFGQAWGAAVAGAAGAARAALPGMLERGRGSILFSGATAALRGGAGFAAFAAAKFAQRGLAQALAREFQPRGIHVAHVVIDGILAQSASARRFAVDGERAVDPEAAADAYLWLARQPASAFSHEIDVRPNTERF
ncbi:MAG TPA: SDR family NAD(P)-dependent oxidoreductase [Burkholderiales bacterium]